MTTPIHADHPKKKRIRHPFDVKTLMDTFDISAGAAATVLIIMGIVISIGIVYFIHSAPPTTITMTSGPEGSA